MPRPEGYHRRYYQSNKEACRNRAKRHYNKHKGSNLVVRFNTGVKNAKARGYCWEIPFETYVVLAALPCLYCGDSTLSTGHGLDRKDSSIGYLVDNVVPCCKVCNKIKCSYLSYEEMIVAMKAVLKQRAAHVR